MSFKSFIGNEAVVARLKRMIANDRLPHALLFAGQEGVGKRLLALELAKLLNCLHPRDLDPCDECRNCRKIAAGIHADVTIIEAQEAVIKIGQVRELRDEINFRPFEGREKVFIIDGAERMNAEAANSVLKTLEEPPDGSRLILVSTSAHALLPTIVSRCQSLQFNPISPAQIRSLLEQRFGYTAEDAKLAARLSGGSVGRALSLDLNRYRGLRQDALAALESIIVLRSFVSFTKHVQAIAKSPDLTDEWLSAMMLLVRDMIAVRTGAGPDLILNFDVTDKLTRMARLAQSFDLEKLAARLCDAERRIQKNANRQLTLEALFVQAQQD